MVDEDVEQIADEHTEWCPEPTRNGQDERQNTDDNDGDRVQDQHNQDTHNQKPEDVALDKVEYSAEFLAEETSIWLALKMSSTFGNAAKNSIEVYEQAVLPRVVYLACPGIDMLLGIECLNAEQDTDAKWARPRISHKPEETISGPADKPHFVE